MSKIQTALKRCSRLLIFPRGPYLLHILREASQEVETLLYLSTGTVLQIQRLTRQNTEMISKALDSLFAVLPLLVCDLIAAKSAGDL